MSSEGSELQNSDPNTNGSLREVIDTPGRDNQSWNKDHAQYQKKSITAKVREITILS